LTFRFCFGEKLTFRKLRRNKIRKNSNKIVKKLVEYFFEVFEYSLVALIVKNQGEESFYLTKWFL
jgi:hypothetical protein